MTTAAEWRTVDKGHLNPEREDFRVTFTEPCRALPRFDHPTRPADATLRRIRRLADECDVTDHNGRQVSVDFHLVAGVEHFRSSVLFRRARDTLAAKAFRVRLPPEVVPEDIYTDPTVSVPHRAAVEAVAEPLASMRPPIKGTYVYITDDGFPHVVYGSTYVPPRNDGEFPAPAVTDFLAELKPAVQRALDGGPWQA